MSMAANTARGHSIGFSTPTTCKNPHAHTRTHTHPYTLGPTETQTTYYYYWSAHTIRLLGEKVVMSYLLLTLTPPGTV